VTVGFVTGPWCFGHGHDGFGYGVGLCSESAAPSQVPTVRGFFPYATTVVNIPKKISRKLAIVMR